MSTVNTFSVRWMLVAALLLLRTATAADTVTPKLLAEHGKAKLWQVGEQRLMLLVGSHYDMGVQHGKLLPDEAKACLRAFLNDFAIERERNTRDTFAQIWKQSQPNIPQKYKDELRGLADGSGIALEDLQLLHAIPSRYHCSGAAAFGKATRDGKLYHTRSLDYYLDIGKDRTVQENAVTIVYLPDEGHPHMSVSWAGFVGCVTGMNAKGISVGEMGCKSKGETFDGLPMIFLLREVLSGADSVDAALEITRRAPRDCGYNFIFADGKRNAAVAVEVNKDHVKAFPAGGSAENVEPHFALPDCVRRTNHFVDKDLAALQRDGYNPQFSAPASWLSYLLISNYLTKHAGKLDAESMIGLLRIYPPAVPCLHQAVMSPGQGEFYVSNAKNPRQVKTAGAQNQTFYKYRLDDILAGSPKPSELHPPLSAVGPPRSAVAPAAAPAVAQRGTVPGDPKLRIDSNGSDERLRKFLAPFDKLDADFAWNLGQPKDSGFGYTVQRLTYDSPIKSGHAENDTVIADYYRPVKPGRLPATIVLDILDGRNRVSSFLADFLAKQGVACLTVRMAYFGERRPKDVSFIGRMVGEPEMMFAGMTQSVTDVGRAAVWLRTRPEIDPTAVSVSGVSMGGFVAGVSSGVYGNFARTVLVLAAGDVAEVLWTSKGERAVEEWVRKCGMTREQLTKRCEFFDSATYAARIPAGSVLMLNARNDPVVPAACAEKLAATLHGVTHVWYDANHYTFALFAFDALKRIGEHLLSAPPPEAARR